MAVRLGNSFTKEEVEWWQQLCRTIDAGGDATVLMRAKACASMRRKFVAMSKRPSCTSDPRVFIPLSMADAMTIAGLMDVMSFTEIARVLGYHRTSMRRGVRRWRKLVADGHYDSAVMAAE